MTSITRTVCLFLFTCLTHNLSGQWTPDFPQILNRHSFGLQGSIERVEEVQSRYGDEGQKITVTQMVFDAAGRIDSLIITDTNKIRTLQVFNYIEDTLLSSKVVYAGRKGGDSTSFLYGKGGRLREIQRFAPNGRHTERIRYRYDGAGRLNYVMKNDGDNVLQEIIRFRYPSDDGYVRSVFNEHQQYISGTQFIYKEDAATRQWTRFYYQGTPDSCTGVEDITFNEAGGEIRRIVMTGNRRMTAYSTATYNTAGHPEEQTEFSEETETEVRIRFEYRYDNEGNWISRTTLRNDALEMATAREITYKPADPEG